MGYRLTFGKSLRKLFDSLLFHVRNIDRLLKVAFLQQNNFALF